MMKSLRALLLAAVLSAASALVQQTHAVNVVQLVTFNIKSAVPGPNTSKGNNLTTPLMILRAAPKDFIEFIGEHLGVTFGPRAQIYIRRENFGEETETLSSIIRAPGREDTDISEFFGFARRTGIVTGSVNTVNGRFRTTGHRLSELFFSVPDQIDLFMIGYTIDTAGNFVIKGAESATAIFSLSANLAGEGMFLETGDPFLFLNQGTLRLGPAKLDP